MALPLLALMGIGAGMGMLKNQEKKRQFDEQKRIQAETTRMSPWTGMSASAPEQYSSTGNVLEGAMGGLSMHQNMGRAAKQDELMDAYLANLKNQNTGLMPMQSAWNYSPSMQQQPYTFGNPWNF